MFPLPHNLTFLLQRMRVIVTAATMVLLALNSAESVQGLVKVGSFRNLQHGVEGQVYAKDEKTIVIKNFGYDGSGPDAFFWAGKSGRPSGVGTILPYPFEGKFYEYEDQSAPILDRRFSGEEITLTLPDSLKASEIRWLSIWCRRFSVNFGDIFFPEDGVKFEKKEELPPPIIGNDVEKKWGDSDDDAAYAEPEAESEAEPEGEQEPKPYGSACCTGLSKLLLILVPLLVKLM